MKGSGNGTPETCAANLLHIVRGEVPYDRVRGRDGSLVDKPNVTDEAIADAEWLLETYEPRIEMEKVEVIAEDVVTGDFSLVAGIKKKEGGE